MKQPSRGTIEIGSATIGVLICSYRRPDSLQRVLDALQAQQRKPDDVLVVVRHDDAQTLARLTDYQQHTRMPLRSVAVVQPGTVHALNAGLNACRSDILAITDDDTVPHPDWLARIGAHFAADPQLGGLGGRDWCHDGKRFDDQNRAVVGRLQWFGRTIGNHHLGRGAPREVEFLKGANMSYRSELFAAIRFDTRLRGSGAQPAEDVGFSLAVRRAGWRLLYDPLVAVDHYAARREEPRHYVGVSQTADMTGLFDFAHNEFLALWPSLSWLGRAAYLPWSFFVGTGPSPGLLQALRYTPKLGNNAWRRFAAVQRGKFAGLLQSAAPAGGLRPSFKAVGEIGAKS